MRLFTLTLFILLGGCTAIWPDYPPPQDGNYNPGDVMLDQTYVFNPETTVEFVFVDEVKHCDNTGRKRVNGCIAPPTQNGLRVIRIADDWNKRWLTGVAKHECDHYAFGPLHTTLSWSHQHQRYVQPRTEADTSDPQAALKREAHRYCMDTFAAALREHKQ